MYEIVMASLALSFRRPYKAPTKLHDDLSLSLQTEVFYSIENEIQQNVSETHVLSQPYLLLMDCFPPSFSFTILLFLITLQLVQIQIRKVCFKMSSIYPSLYTRLAFLDVNPNPSLKAHRLRNDHWVNLRWRPFHCWLSTWLQWQTKPLRTEQLPWSSRVKTGKPCDTTAMQWLGDYFLNTINVFYVLPVWKQDGRCPCT